MENNQITCQKCIHNRASWMERTFKVNSWSWTCDLDYTPPAYNVVDGTTTPGRYESCGVVRVKKAICGPDATRWQPRDKKDFFTYLKRI